MGINRGKKFEAVIKNSFERISDVSIDRLHDQTTGFKGSQNICDFIVYKKPNQYYIECKSVHGNTLSFRNITDTQWDGLFKKSRIEGVYAGVICWWIDKNITKFIPIHLLHHMKQLGYKSIRYDDNTVATLSKPMQAVIIKGKKKRVFFDYDMEEFLNELSKL